MTRLVSRPALLLALSMTVVAPLPAAEFCATTSAQLQNALTVAATNGQADIIRVAAGVYTAPPGGFSYNAGVSGGDTHDLTLIGGWTPFFDNPCGQLLVENPFDTLLNGNDVTRVMNIRLSGGENLSVRLLGFMNGNAAPPAATGGGLRIQSAGACAGTLTVERNAFVGNEADIAGGLDASCSADGSARLNVINNLILGNHGRTGTGGLRLIFTGGDEGPGGAAMVVANNTVLDNSSDNVAPTGGMQLDGTVPNRYVVNNNLWNNQGDDLRVLTGGSIVYVLMHNNFGSRSGASPSQQSGNISVEPVYETCFLCFTWVPVIDSPLVDAGAYPTQLPQLLLSEYDLRGRARISGGRVDIGAYENHVRLFSDRFEQP